MDAGPQESLRDCRVFFFRALEGSDGSKHELTVANKSARDARPLDCAQCLGAIGIQCPLKYGTDEEISPFGVDREALELLRNMDPLATKRLKKSLERTDTPRPNPPLNRILALGLTEAGFPQQMGRFPEITDKADTSASGNTVPDPRDKPKNKPPEDIRQERPPCAKDLNLFVREHRGVIEAYKPDRENPRPIDHSKDEATWSKAIGNAKLAQAPDCANCLGTNCPLLNGVNPSKFYNSVNKQRVLPSGKAVRATEIVLRITSGGMRGVETVEEIDDLENNLERKVSEAQAA